MGGAPAPSATYADADAAAAAAHLSASQAMAAAEAAQRFADSFQVASGFLYVNDYRNDGLMQCTPIWPAIQAIGLAEVPLQVAACTSLAAVFEKITLQAVSQCSLGA